MSIHERLPVLSPMSLHPDFTVPPAASASVSIGWSDQWVTPTVARPVDGEDLAGVPGVVGREEQTVVAHQGTRLDDRGVVEREHLVAVRLGRCGERTEGERGGDRQPGQELLHQAAVMLAEGSPRRGRTPQAATSSSYSRRAEPPLTGRPVRTPRSRVLRGVC
jgi:hypothetical protein